LTGGAPIVAAAVHVTPDQISDYVVNRAAGTGDGCSQRDDSQDRWVGPHHDGTHGSGWPGWPLTRCRSSLGALAARPMRRIAAVLAMITGALAGALLLNSSLALA